MTKNKYKHISNGIYYSDGSFCAVDTHDITFLKDAALQSKQKRSRICFHADPSNLQQEMLIVTHQSSYIRPHRHFEKLETLTIIDGACDAMIFDENGNLLNNFLMTTASEGGFFFYRMPAECYHSLIISSEWLVFLETTIGPFNHDKTQQAQWAPDDSQAIEGLAYLRNKIAC